MVVHFPAHHAGDVSRYCERPEWVAVDGPIYFTGWEGIAIVHVRARVAASREVGSTSMVLNVEVALGETVLGTASIVVDAGLVASTVLVRLTAALSRDAANRYVITAFTGRANTRPDSQAAPFAVLVMKDLASVHTPHARWPRECVRRGERTMQAAPPLGRLPRASHGALSTARSVNSIEQLPNVCAGCGGFIATATAWCARASDATGGWGRHLGDLPGQCAGTFRQWYEHC